ncbi:proline-rich receptor-like protein kinase PERK2 [Iris pallida]|uniref:Proline-rich receptor-like protein kinase PERK2 n=1 Tax=Iris pallida TaxID=29817 RepID=A0AAX6IM35_IRIPA|nr:proline-rich receptor-like protein kinase PERK2 [Iris pallida]
MARKRGSIGRGRSGWNTAAVLVKCGCGMVVPGSAQGSPGQAATIVGPSACAAWSGGRTVPSELAGRDGAAALELVGRACEDSC